MSSRENRRVASATRILAAAQDLFVDQGFAGTTLAQVAARAGVAVGTVYNYVPSKGDLLLAVIRSRVGDRVTEMEAALLFTGQDAGWPVLKGLVEAYLSGFTALGSRIWREFFAFALAERPELFPSIRELDTLFIERLTVLTGPETAQFLYAAWIHHLLEYLTDPDQHSFDTVVGRFHRDWLTLTS